jgi:hypothetical protein
MEILQVDDNDSGTYGRCSDAIAFNVALEVQFRGILVIYGFESQRLKDVLI